MKPNLYAARCPSRQLVATIGDKWTLLILPLLRRGPRRNSELMAMIEGISQKMLVQTLRRLEQCKLVRRVDYGEIPPRVDYRLTPLGSSLVELIDQLDQWVLDNFEEMMRPVDA